jgi:hypothetical protein
MRQYSELVFGRCLVRVSVETQDTLTGVSWYCSVAQASVRIVFLSGYSRILSNSCHFIIHNYGTSRRYVVSGNGSVLKINHTQ